MTGDIGESMIVRFEGKSRVKGNTKKFNRCRSRDNLAVIRDVLLFELLALSPVLESPTMTPQCPTIIQEMMHNHPQSPTITHNDPGNDAQSPTITHNHPQSPRK